MAGGSVLTQVGGINTATYQDVGGTIPLPNPIPLNSRGEVSSASGASQQLFLTPNIVYTFTFSDASGNQEWVAQYVNGVLITQQSIGQMIWPQTSAEIATGVIPTFYYYPPGDFRRYGALGDGTTDDTAGITTAFKTGQLCYGGGSQYTYLYNSSISIPTGVSIRFDGQGCTMLPGNSAAIHNTNVTVTASTTVTGTAEGSVTLTAASTTGLVVGQYEYLSAPNMPSTWGRIRSIVGTTVTVDTACPVTYAGTVTMTAYNESALYQQIEVRNVTFDGSHLVSVNGSIGQCFRFVTFVTASILNVEVKNFNTSTGTNLLSFFELFTGAQVVIQGCKLHDNLPILGTSPTAVGIEVDDCGQVSIVNNVIEGSHFGVNVTRCTQMAFTGNILRGQSTYEISLSSSISSVRGIKVSSVATALITGNTLDDYSSPIRLDVGFRASITGNTVRNEIWKSGSLDTNGAIHMTNTAVTTQYGLVVSDNVIENAGGHGILCNQSSGSASAPIRLIVSGNYIDSCQGFAINIVGLDALISANIIKDWDLSNNGSSSIGNQAANNICRGATISANTFIHTVDNTKVCINAPGQSGFVYAIDRSNRSPTGNPLFGGTNFLWNSGTGSILSGTTSIDVTHGVFRAPTADEITLNVTTAASNPPGLIWISGINSTKFTVNCAANPGASNLPFSWQVAIKQPYTV
jgi:hypothetical protein